jgi:hypothetical protein
MRAGHGELTPVIPASREAEIGEDHGLRPAQGKGQQSVSWMWWHAPVISATQKAIVRRIIV